MSTTTMSSGSSAVPAQKITAGTPTLGRSGSGAALAATHAGLFVVTLVVLGSAIGWPGVLREPPPVVFERIGAAATATRIGYTSYLLSSLLMIPLAFVLRDLLGRAGMRGAWMDTVAFVGAAAGVLKTIGIVRWLTAMPVLASRHAAAPDDAARQVVESVFVGVNAYGGSIGEMLGVQLLGGSWIVGISLALWIAGGRRWVGGFGLVVGALTLVLASRPFFPEIGALEMVAGPLWLVWLASLAVMLGRRRG